MTITDWPASWYPAITAKQLPVGAVQVCKLGGHELVIARGESGKAFAFDAHCPHMGAHLRHAQVTGDSLRCPLHHWLLSAADGCEKATSGIRSWPVREHLGVVFIGFAVTQQKLPPLPGEGLLDKYYWTTSEPTDINVNWKAAIVNGFDLTHLSTVHHRALVNDPIFEVGTAFLRLKYETRVTGTSLSDRFTHFLSGDLIKIEQRCLGTTIEVRSQLKKISTAAIVSILPTDNGVRVFGVFGVRPGRLAFLRGQLAKLLFSSFLKKDIKILEGMRLQLDTTDDAGVKAVVGFLRTLQEGPVITEQPAANDRARYTKIVQAPPKKAASING